MSNKKDEGISFPKEFQDFIEGIRGESGFNERQKDELKSIFRDVLEEYGLIKMPEES